MRIGRRGEGFLAQNPGRLMLAVAIPRRTAESQDDHVRAVTPDHPNHVGEDAIMAPLLQGLVRGAGEAEIDSAGEKLFGPIDLPRGQHPVLPERALHLRKGERGPRSRQPDGWIVAEVGRGLGADVAVNGPQAQLRVERHAEVPCQARPLDRVREAVLGITGSGVLQGGDTHEDLGRSMQVEQPLHLRDGGGSTATVSQRKRAQNGFGDRAHR